MKRRIPRSTHYEDAGTHDWPDDAAGDGTTSDGAFASDGSGGKGPKLEPTFRGRSRRAKTGWTGTGWNRGYIPHSAPDGRVGGGGVRCRNRPAKGPTHALHPTHGPQHAWPPAGKAPGTAKLAKPCPTPRQQHPSMADDATQMASMADTRRINNGPDTHPSYPLRGLICSCPVKRRQSPPPKSARCNGIGRNAPENQK